MKTEFDWTRADAKTDADIHAAAMKDPDARPLTDEEFARAKRVPRRKTCAALLA